MGSPRVRVYRPIAGHRVSFRPVTLPGYKYLESQRLSTGIAEYTNLLFAYPTQVPACTRAPIDIMSVFSAPLLFGSTSLSFRCKYCRGW